MAKTRTSKDTKTNYTVRTRRVNNTRIPKQRVTTRTKRASSSALGKYLVTDPKMYGGKLTFIGTRILVSDVLEMVAQEIPWKKIIEEFRGEISKEAIAEAVRLASQVLMSEAKVYLKAHDAHLGD